MSISAPVGESSSAEADADEVRAVSPAEVDEVLEATAPWLARYPRRSVGQRSRVGRRLVDVAVGSALLILVAPILLIALVLVRLSDPRAPVIYRQERTGLNGNRFSIFKIRTMVTNADELRDSLAAQNSREWPDFKVKRDPRITRLGRIFRPINIDELPQFVNVIRGDMSLVGPRPTSLHPSSYESWHHERLDALPGMTGVWQVAMRDDPSFRRRVILDIEYVRRSSLRLDLMILLRTVFALRATQGDR